MSNINELLQEMSLEEKIGQMLHLAVLTEKNGWPSQEMKMVIEEFKPGAVRVYNFFGKQNTPFFKAEYTKQLQKLAGENSLGIPLIISADCEFGLGEITDNDFNSYPFLMGRTSSGSIEMAENISYLIAREASAAGFNMLHQPDVDVNTNHQNPVIGVRSAGDQVDDVIEYSKAQLRGQQKAGLISVAKHFPGHGDTDIDSHLGLPVVDFDKKVLKEIHLRPFKEVIEAGVDGIMTSHIIVKCLDEKEPVTLSKNTLTNLLRKELDFDGFIMTDAMTMKAIADNYGIKEAAVKAVQAGADLILASGDFKFQKSIRDVLIKAVNDGEISIKRIDQSVTRILKVKEKYNWFKNYEVSSPRVINTINNNYDFSVESYKKSYTVKGKSSILPIKKDSRILLTGVKEVNNLISMISSDYSDIISYQLNSAVEENDWSPSNEDIENVIKIARNVETVIVLSYTYNLLPENQKLLIKKMAETLPVVVISLGIPYGYESIMDKSVVIETLMQNRWGVPSPIPPAASEALISILKGDFITK